MPTTATPPRTSLTSEVEADLKAAGCPTILTLSEAAKFADEDYSGLWRAIQAGSLRAFRKAGLRTKWRVRRADLATYLTAQQSQVT